MKWKLLTRFPKILRQSTTGFALLAANRVGAVPEFPSTYIFMKATTCKFAECSPSVSDRFRSSQSPSTSRSSSPVSVNLMFYLNPTCRKFANYAIFVSILREELPQCTTKTPWEHVWDMGCKKIRQRNEELWQKKFFHTCKLRSPTAAEISESLVLEFEISVQFEHQECLNEYAPEAFEYNWSMYRRLRGPWWANLTMSVSTEMETDVCYYPQSQDHCRHEDYILIGKGGLGICSRILGTRFKSVNVLGCQPIGQSLYGHNCARITKTYLKVSIPFLGRGEGPDYIGLKFLREINEAVPEGRFTGYWAEYEIDNSRPEKVCPFVKEFVLSEQVCFTYP
ncbi:hypothetical protein CSKR_101156 [Clonorchis sinensis]|uniref:Uncharacterized protein n=1 Tax=Clonorchis sinensis TaxID=79923 RepID=A0A419Q8H3_CLOSI|nr:hypothetical protein CSKR_101156 [Clonorchis sinensis]